MESVNLLLDSVVFFAIGTAICFALADMLIRSGLQHTNAFVGATISLASQLAFLFLLSPFLGFGFPPLNPDYLWIMAGGVGQPALFVIFFMIGISRIGVSRAAPIKGTSPLFGSILAILFLGERPAWFHLAGIVLVVAGVALVSSGKTEGRWRRKDALWPILAAISAGLGAIFWRRGLSGFPDPLAAAVVALSTSLVVVGTYTFLTMRGRDAGNLPRALGPFLTCGVVAGTAHIFLANALQRGEVYRVLPLVQVAPLFTVVFALILVRHVENITWRVPAGALLTAGGAILGTLRGIPF
ncbi:DMT family transporter [Nitrospinota bacterium]